MVQSPSWEANWFSASQEIPGILWNPNAHYRIHKRPPPVPAQSIIPRVRGFLCERFLTWCVLTVRSCSHLAQPPRGRTTPCRLSEILYSIYSQQRSILKTVPHHPQPGDVPCRRERDPLITAVDIISRGMWERADKWDIGNQLDYLKAYIRPFAIKITKNYELN
jgi:hypothetical protein